MQSKIIVLPYIKQAAKFQGGENGMKTGRRLIISYGVIAAATVLFLCWLFFGFSVSRSSFPINETKLLSVRSVEEDDVLVQSITLQNDFEETQTLLFKTTHTKVEVQLGDEIVYRYGWEEDAPAFLKSPGTLWHMVKLPDESSQSELQIRLYNVYDGYFGNKIEIRYGSDSACVLFMITNFLPIFLINCIIVFAGIISIILHVALRSHEKKYQTGSFLCVGLFSMAIAVWSLCQCGFLQMVIPDARTLYFVDFFSFYLFPVPFNLFVSTICQTKYRKGFFALAGIYMLNLLVVTVIQLLGWRDIFELLSVTHIIMLLNVVYVFFGIWQEVEQKQNETARRFQIPLYIVMLFAAAELVAYYARGMSRTSVFLPLGTIVFICLLIWMQVGHYYNRKLEEQKLQYYEKLANTDMLTEAMNRNAYEDMIRKMEQQEMQWNTTCVVMFDVNDMKHINDNYGHEKGDEALKICYHCICQAFGADGNCYRIGGDEFIYVSSCVNDLEEKVERFEALVARIGQGLPYPFGVAVGYAKYDNEEHEKFRETIRRSDAMMYENKRKTLQ